MPVTQPFVITSPGLRPPGREWWLEDPTVGPRMTATTVATVFYGWAARTLNAKLVQVKDEYDIPLVENSRRFAKREFSLFDIERITHLFLNRGIIDYRRFHSAIQILTCMARNYDLV